MQAESKTGTVVEKPWGHELIWSHTDHYIGKLIAIKAGKRLSLQLHRQKDESIYVMSGLLRLHIQDDTGQIRQIEMKPGTFQHVPTGIVHRFEAIEDTQLIEVSTTELDDVVRLEDDYGRQDAPAAASSR